MPIKKDHADVSVPKIFDITFLNMMYVCASTMQQFQKSKPLQQDISRFYLSYFIKMQNDKSFSEYYTTKKFRKFAYSQANDNVYEVPKYPIDKIEKLAETLYKRFKLYFDIANTMEIKINALQIESREVSRQFSIITQEQYSYFEREKQMLDEIADYSGSQWKWSFEHR